MSRKQNNIIQMPTVATSFRVKRLLSRVLRNECENDEPSPKKACLVKFEESVKVIESDRDRGELDQLNESLLSHSDDDEETDFVFSLDENGDFDFSIVTNKLDRREENECGHETALQVQILFPSEDVRRSSFFSECDRCLCEELKEEEDYIETASESSQSVDERYPISTITPNALSINLPMPIPLITPPSSPRRVRTELNGVAEEATICEWPCNLTVDNAIRSALESVPNS